MNKPKIHYGPKDVPGGFRMLPCSGRAVLRAAFTSKGNEVTCRLCQRTVNKQVAAALAAYWGVPA
jgi:hypothetical protein